MAVDWLEQPDAERGYQYSFRDPEQYVFKSRRGLSREVVAQISEMKGEPAWMRDFRFEALNAFHRRPVPTWGPDLSGIGFEDLFYYVKPAPRTAHEWGDVPEAIRKTYERLGIPEAEKTLLAGVGAQYESEMIYHKLRADLSAQGVIFLGTDAALQEQPDLFRRYFATVVPPYDNTFAALNSAVWSGGNFIYVPKGVRVDLPLQAYFRMNAEHLGQFERTLIIVDEGAHVQYVEGCTAPASSAASLHSAVVEIVVKRGARCRCTTIQNWPRNVYNLVTERAVVEGDATMEWVDGNLGSKVTMKYPAIWLRAPGARGEVLSITFASDGQHLDAGGKVVHLAPHTASLITSKSISKGSGRASYRGLLKVEQGAHHAKSTVVCDALLLDERSRTDTYPYIEIAEQEVEAAHEATVTKVGAEQLFYLMSRGLSRADATALIVRGFLEPIAKELPLEYAVALNRLIQLEMAGSLG